MPVWLFKQEDQQQNLLHILRHFFFFCLFSFSHQKEENKIPQGCEKCNSLLGSKQRTMDDSEVKTSKGISVK